MKAKERDNLRDNLIEEFKDTTWILYGQETGEKKYFAHMCSRPEVVKLYYCEGRICKLEFSVHKNQSKKTITKNTDYHGWISFEDGNKLQMVWASQGQCEMCFPYGSKAEEEKHGGIMVRLNIKVFEEKL